MTEPEPWTIGRLLAWTTDYLARHGVASPRLEAEVLLAAARGCRRIDLYTTYHERASAATRETFRQFVQQRVTGTPVAHLVGRREFFSLDFRVTPAVLIPRPETETLVMTLLDRLRDTDAPPAASVADVGTGCGIIAVCAAKYCPTCHVTAIDISRAALDVAATNAAAHGVADRIELVESDLLGGFAPERTFDVIASNPPYVATADMDRLPVEVKDHEPRTALAAGPTGTEIIERLIAQAAPRLRHGGWLLVEISPEQEPAVTQSVARNDGLEPQATIPDLAGRPRVVQARRG